MWPKICITVMAVYVLQNLLSVSRIVTSMVSKRISPIPGVKSCMNCKRTVSFGSRAMLSLVKVIRTFAGVVVVTRIDV